MRSTVAALCLLFVAGFLRGNVEPALDSSVRAASVSVREQDVRRAHAASARTFARAAAGRRTWPRAACTQPRTMRVALGYLPAPRAPDARS